MKIALAVAVLMLASCQPLTQQSRQQEVRQQEASTGASQASVDFVRAVQGDPPPVPIVPPAKVGDVKVEGKYNTVTVNVPTSQPAMLEGEPIAGYIGRTGHLPQHSSTTTAAMNTKQRGDSGSSFYSEGKVSVSLTVIGWAVGIGLLALVLFLIIKAVRSGAFGAGAQAGFDTADAAVSKQIHAIESQLQTATDPAVRATLLANLAAANQTRGTIAATSPAPPTP